MKKFLSRLFSFVSKHKILAIVSLLIVIAAASAAFRNNSVKLETAVVSKGDVKSIVSVTGKVVPIRNIDLAFEKPGRIAYVYVQVNSKVEEGRILASLENSDLLAQLEQAKGSVLTQEAKLKELQNGAKPEDIALAEAKLQNAQIAEQSAKKNLFNSIQDAYTKADDSIRNKSDSLFYYPTTNPTLSFFGIDSQQKASIESLRLTIEHVLVSWKAQIQSASVDGDLDLYRQQAESNLSQVRSFLDSLSYVLNTLSTNASVSQATLDTWKAAVSAARTNVYAAISNLSAMRDAFITVQSNVSVAEKSLALERAPATAEQILQQQGQVEQAKASQLYYGSQIEKTLIRAPFSGTITRVGFHTGDIVNTNNTVVSIIGTGAFQTEVYIAESDISKIKTGQKARITLDAYGNDVIFGSTVVRSDLSATVLEGVATYKTVLQFDKEDARILSGLTTNIDILVDKKENVLYVPTRSIISNDGQKFVKVVNGNTVTEKEVIVGLRGSDGRTEIISGLKEGDKITQ